MRKMGESSDIRVPVIDDLTFDPYVDASDIRVAEVNEDVVTPSVPSYPQYVQATAVAARPAASDACATTCRWRYRPAITCEPAPSGKRQK
jgi:hypothetical protein